MKIRQKTKYRYNHINKNLNFIIKVDFSSPKAQNLKGYITKEVKRLIKWFFCPKIHSYQKKWNP